MNIPLQKDANVIIPLAGLPYTSSFFGQSPPYFWSNVHSAKAPLQLGVVLISSPAGLAKAKLRSVCVYLHRHFPIGYRYVRYLYLVEAGDSLDWTARGGAASFHGRKAAVSVDLNIIAFEAQAGYVIHIVPLGWFS